MSNQILLSATQHNLDACIELAIEKGFGIELMTFGFAEVLDSNWQDFVRDYQDRLQEVPGTISLHGPFIDLVSGSPDPKINQIAQERYRHAIQIAEMLGIHRVVYHANFIGTMHIDFYRKGWHERNLVFWQEMAEYARAHGVVLALENMWEFDPYIIGDLLSEIDHPNLRACIDVGHVGLYGDEPYSFRDWLQVMAPWVVQFHINNNDGKVDDHHALGWEKGALDYQQILPLIQAIPSQPDIVLEMYTVDDMRHSLGFFEPGLIRSFPR
ncbi:hypothetical protein MASR2M15_13280 [Anaerolineales bacterium]